MGKVVAGMTMSLDGFVADAGGSLSPLYPDFEEMHQYPALLEAIEKTGAVVMGRRTFAMADPDSYAVDYEFQVPIFVLAHQPPERHPAENESLTFTFISEGVESAIMQAKAAAGDKDVTVVGGASTVQQILRADLADELHVDVIPVVLGAGLRLFEHLEGVEIALEKIDVQESAVRTMMRFRVVK